jgi:hypothetical protein
MSEPLQSFGYRDSPYIRPGQKWICGHTADGCPCLTGPDGSGRCRGGHECEPLRVGDRWHCTRSQYNGGPCSDGPLADGTCCRQVALCRPVRSWRARRGVVVSWLIALLAGILVFVMAGADRAAFVSPGELSFQHAELTDCGGCHAAFHEGIAGWWRAAWSEDSAEAASAPCINCHKMGSRGLLPHSLPAAEMAVLRKNAAPAAAGGRTLGVQLANLAYGKTRANIDPLPCMTCHGEHQGAEADWTRMSNDRCTACHQAQFHSLASGHPDFAQYPYERRTLLQFDHTSHIDKHFRDEKMAQLAPGDCRGCHKTDANSRLMRLKPFEVTCGGCHGDQIAGAGRATAKGMAVFSVPGLDVESLRDRGAAIGEWPEFAEDAVPPFMHLLLSANPKYRAVQGVLAEIDDPMDLSEASDSQLAAVETLAWAVKSLFFDIRGEGAATLHARLQVILRRPLTMAEQTSLTALLPLDSVVAAQREWFPALGSEMPRWRNGESVEMPAAEAEPESRGEGTADDPDKDDDADDDEIKTGRDDDEEIDTGKDDDDEDDDDEIKTGKDDDDDDDEEIDTGKDDDDDDEDDEIKTGKDDDDDDEEIDTGKDDDEDDEDSDKVVAGDNGNGRAGITVMEAIDGEEWNIAGGWYRDEYTLRYRPTGHGDRFIRSWLDLTGRTANRLDESAQVFESLIEGKAPGLCGKCHSVDQQGDQGLAVNWRGYGPADGLKKSVRFSHASHFRLLDEKGCTTCHQRDAKADFAGPFKQRDPAVFNPNFKPLPRAVCAECHTAEKAGDNCLICHNYHFGVFQPVMARFKGKSLKSGQKP